MISAPPGRDHHVSGAQGRQRPRRRRPGRAGGAGAARAFTATGGSGATGAGGEGGGREGGNLGMNTSRKHTKNYGKSPFLMGKLTINGHFQ